MDEVIFDVLFGVVTVLLIVALLSVPGAGVLRSYYVAGEHDRYRVYIDYKGTRDPSITEPMPYEKALALADALNAAHKNR